MFETVVSGVLIGLMLIMVAVMVGLTIHDIWFD